MGSWDSLRFLEVHLVDPWGSPCGLLRFSVWTVEDLLVVRWDLRGPLRPLCLNSWWINITMLLYLWRLIFGWSYAWIFGKRWITRIHEHSYISFLILLQNSFSGYWTHSHFTPVSVKYIRRALAQKVRWRPWGLGACPDPPFRSFESASASAAGWEQASDRYYLRLPHTDTHTPAGLVGLGWPDQLVPWQESVALRGPDGGLGVSIDCWTTSSDFVKQAPHQLQLATWWVTLGMR